MYKKNPKLVDTNITDCIPQCGPCPMGCSECFYNRPGAFYTDITKPNIPTKYDVGDKIVRMNCLAGDTNISLVSGKEVSIKSLVNTQPVWIYAYNHKTGEIVPQQATAIYTGKSLKMLRITLDNGQSIECTKNHKWLLRDGTYCQAKDLKIGVSLMPLYRKMSYNYEQYLCPGTGRWRYTHRWFVPGIKPEAKKMRDYVVHHINFNKTDNTPNNLMWMTKLDHHQLHFNFKNPMNDPKVRKKLSDLRKSQRGSDSNRFNHNLNNETIIKLYTQDKWSAKQVADLIGCAENTVTNRLKTLGIVPRDSSSITPLGKQKKSQKSLAMWQNKEKRKSIIEAGATKKVLAKKIKGIKFRWSKPGAKKAHSNRIKELWANTKWREKILSDRKAKRNHKIIAITQCEVLQSGYDLQVAQYHNFAISAGVFVHNCGHDSNLQKKLVLETAKVYKKVFFNTSIPNFEFPSPVVYTANPKEEEPAFLIYKEKPVPKNLMFVRLRISATNLPYIKEAVNHYTSIHVPVMLTFMSYYSKEPKAANVSTLGSLGVELWGVQCYEWRIRHINSYYCPTKKFIQIVMNHFSDNRLVSMCSSINDSYCRACRNCETYFIQTAKRLHGE